MNYIEKNLLVAAYGRFEPNETKMFYTKTCSRINEECANKRNKIENHNKINEF